MALPTGTVTFLFSDIEGSTRLAAALEDRFAAVLQDHQRLLREVFSAAGGIEIATEGDSFFVVFRSASKAVAAAIDAQRALRDHAWPSEGDPVRVRMGLHTGEGTLGGDNYAGLDVNRAARIAAAAHGGQVLLSAATREVIADALADVRELDLGEHRLKDLDRPERIWQVVVDDLPSEFPAPRTLEVPTNLPPQVTSFIGREQEVAELRELLANTRLLTLTGPGGTGKTRLSLRVAQDVRALYPGGVHFVELASITEPSLIPGAIAAAIGLRENPQRPVLEVVKEHLATRRSLLVLDNFEQILAGAAVVSDLLRSVDGLTVMTSSREPLRIAGEQEYPVPPLGLPDLRNLPPLDVLSHYDSVALFIQRARAVRPGFEIDNANAPAVAAICARLDGLPLAIELAASRIKLFAPDQLLTRLETSLLGLTGARDLPARQQTLRGAIDWSHDLLEPEERMLFRRLAVFRDGFTVDSAEAIAGPSQRPGLDVVDGLGSLIDKSLLRRDESEPAVGEPRFAMLETIRDYGGEQLTASDDRDAIPQRHAEFFAGLARAAEPEIVGEDQARWLDRLESDQANLRAAMAWFAGHGRIDQALLMGGWLWRFWHQRAHLSEGRQALDQLLARPEAAEPLVARVAALEGLGGLTYWQNDFEAADHAYQEALGIARGVGDQRLVAEALYNVAFVANVLDRTEDARAMYEESLAIFEGLGETDGMTRVREGLVLFLIRTKDWSLAHAFEAENLHEYRQLRLPFRIGNATALMSVMSAFNGEIGRATRELAEAIEIFRGAGDLPSLLNCLVLGAGIAIAADDHAAAARIMGGFRAHREPLGAVATAVEILGIPDPETAAREALGDAAFEAELAAGGRLSMAELLDLAARSGAASELHA